VSSSGEAVGNPFYIVACRLSPSMAGGRAAIAMTACLRVVAGTNDEAMMCDAHLPAGVAAGCPSAAACSSG